MAMKMKEIYLALTVVRQALLYGLECWAIESSQEQGDVGSGSAIRGSVGVANIKDKTREPWLWWFGHVMRWGG